MSSAPRTSAARASSAARTGRTAAAAADRRAVDRRAAAHSPAARIPAGRRTRRPVARSPAAPRIRAADHSRLVRLGRRTRPGRPAGHSRAARRAAGHRRAAARTRHHPARRHTRPAGCIRAAAHNPGHRRTASLPSRPVAGSNRSSCLLSVAGHPAACVRFRAVSRQAVGGDSAPFGSVPGAASGDPPPPRCVNRRTSSVDSPPVTESIERADLPTQYTPADVEGRLYERWISSGLFTADPTRNPAAPSFSIVIPPPNVTGSLHMGHALDHSIQDLLVRRCRMQGAETLWLPGMDHAGIATQNVVERELAKEGLSRHDLGRTAFVERVWQWKAESGGRSLGQMKRLGDSVDWSREAFTMDDQRARAVRTIFKRLYDDELIYRAERIINWCPRCLTALSDIEVEHADREGELISIRYGSGDDIVVVATTRAETMLGDTAVAVHPDDDRYRHLVGRQVELPLTGRSIPVVADEHVDPSFGTGAVKVTPAHDPNDFEIGQRHDLPSITVMDDHGVITVHGPFHGLDRFEARPAVVAALREQGRIVKEVRPYEHAVGHCQRCSTVVEPRVSLQWFVRVAPLAKAAGNAVRDGRVRIHPPEMEARYFAWVDNLHDWCISRQLWWGHRIPVWYGPSGEMVCVGPDEPAPDGPGWSQDTDVLDTWFSSALWPFSTLGWPAESADLRRFYPTSMLVTGYDILFFWVARMMMFGLYAMDGVEPFKIIALHGMVRDQHGKKMSKSFGNVVDPLDWIDRYGADATRFTLLRGAGPGDVPVAEEWAQGSRNFCNKLWNATRFALINGAHVRGDLPAERSTADAWILS